MVKTNKAKIGVKTAAEEGVPVVGVGAVEGAMGALQVVYEVEQEAESAWSYNTPLLQSSPGLAHCKHSHLHTLLCSMGAWGAKGGATQSASTVQALKTLVRLT